MNKAVMHHPEEDQILRYADGELPARAARKIRNHLKACWECRAQLQEIEQVVSTCVGYRKTVLQGHLPAPPAPWIDIYQGFAEIDASAEPVFLHDRETVRKRWFNWFTAGAGRWAIAAAALVLICAGIVYRIRVTPTIQAAELLRRAVAAADAQPKDKLKPRLIRIRTSTHSFTRAAGVAKTSDTDAVNSVQTMFVAARYDWQDPLSAKAYSVWRNQLPNKKDEVVEERDRYRVRTSTDSGDLLVATLDLRVRDLHPLEERLEFRNRDWVEISEVAGEAVPENVARDNRPANDLPPGPANSPLTNPQSAPAAEATIADELHAVAALHQVGADLGDPIDVTRNGGKVLVTGIGIAPERQREISEVLATQPQIVVRFPEAAPSQTKPERELPPAETNANPDIRQLQARMAQSVGGRASFDQIAAQVLDLSDNMMSRAYALRRLAERFSPDSEAQFGPQDLQLLQSMRQEHTAALRQQIAEIERVARPILASVSGAANSPDGARLSGGWQSATQELFQTARRLERLLAVVFGAAAMDTSARPEEQLPSRVLHALAELRAKSESYDRLFIQPPERRNR